MKIASGIVLAIVVAIFAFWAFFVRAPGPAVVCDHIIDVTLREADQQNLAMETQAELMERLRERCIEHKIDKIQLRGRLRYADYAKCVLSTNDLAEIERC
jgi:hypothetical protein